MSPDGSRLAVVTNDPKGDYISIYDLAGGTAMRRLTFGGNNRFPIWSRDSQRVTFQSDRDGDQAIFWQLADGTGPAERLTKPDKGTAHVPESWSLKDETLLFAAVKQPPVPYSLWTFSRASRKEEPFGEVQTSTVIGAVFSPDGRWVADLEWRSGAGHGLRPAVSSDRGQVSVGREERRPAPPSSLVGGTGGSSSTTRVRAGSRWFP